MLKIIINQDCVKREIVGTFEIFLDHEARRTLQERLEELPDHHQGWVTIYETPYVRGLPNTKPLPWTAGAPEPTVEVPNIIPPFL